MMPPEDSEFMVPVDLIPPDKAKDFWYWQFDEDRRPISQAAVYLLTDKSGSMTQGMLTLAYKIAYLVILFLTPALREAQDHHPRTYVGRSVPSVSQLAGNGRRQADRWYQPYRRL